MDRDPDTQPSTAIESIDQPHLVLGATTPLVGVNPFACREESAEPKKSGAMDLRIHGKGPTVEGFFYGLSAGASDAKYYWGTNPKCQKAVQSTTPSPIIRFYRGPFIPNGYSPNKMKTAAVGSQGILKQIPNQKPQTVRK